MAKDHCLSFFELLAYSIIVFNPLSTNTHRCTAVWNWEGLKRRRWCNGGLGMLRLVVCK